MKKEKGLSNTFYMIVYAALLLLTSLVSYQIVESYMPSAEDIGYLVSTSQWDIADWFTNGNRYHGYEENSNLVYLRPAPQFASFVYLNTLGKWTGSELWINYILQLLCAVNISFITRHFYPKKSRATSLLTGLFVIVVSSSLELPSLSRYDWLQLNLSVLLFLAGVNLWLRGENLWLMVVVIMAALTKPAWLLLCTVVVVGSLYEKKGRKIIPCIFVSILAYIFFREFTNTSILGAGLENHILYRQKLEGGVMVIFSNLIIPGVSKHNNMPYYGIYIMACVNLALLSWLIAIFCREKDKHLKCFHLLSIVLILACSLFVSAYWKIEVQIIAFLSLIFHFNRNRSVVVMLAITIVFSLSFLIKANDYTRHYYDDHMSYSEQTEFKYLKNIMREVGNIRINKVTWIPDKLDVSTKMLSTYLGYKEGFLNAIGLQCIERGQYSIANKFIDQDGNLLVLSLESDNEGCIKEIPLEEDSIIVFGDSKSRSVYGVYKGEAYKSIYSSRSGVQNIDKKIDFNLTAETCALAEYVSVNFNSSSVFIPYHHENTYFKITNRCTLEIRLLKKGVYTYVINDINNTPIESLSVDMGLLNKDNGS